MNRNNNTINAIEQQLALDAQSPNPEAPEAAAVQGSAPQDAANPEAFDALVGELMRLVQSGTLPEGFDLQAACADASFVRLTQELPMEAAIRVYAAEQRAEQAEARAKERLAGEMQRRAALPQAVRGTGGAPVARDYSAMSSEEFRALEQQYRRAAQRGIKVKL